MLLSKEGLCKRRLAGLKGTLSSVKSEKVLEVKQNKVIYNCFKEKEK